MLKHLVCRGTAVKDRADDESTAATGLVLEAMLNLVVTLLSQDLLIGCSSFFCTCIVHDVSDLASAYLER